jgi:hypothetical protein
VVTVVDNITDGDNGLSAMTSVLTIRGTGAEITSFEQLATAPNFRYPADRSRHSRIALACFG